MLIDETEQIRLALSHYLIAKRGPTMWKMAASCFCGLTLTAAPTFAGVPTYTFTNLGTLFGSAGSYASALNNSGEVVGWTGLSGEAFSYTASGGVTMLGAANRSPFFTPPLPPGGYATAINDSGTIVGYGPTTGGSYNAFIYYNGVMDDIGSPSQYSRALSVNDSGTVVGPSAKGGFVYSNGTTTYLPEATQPVAVNYAGTIAGNTVSNTGAFTGGFTYSNGTINYFSVPGDITGMNNFGELVGNTYTFVSSPTGAYNIYNAFVSGPNGTVLRYLVPAPSSGAGYFASAVNDFGNIVGYISNTNQINTIQTYAFVDSANVMYDLNSITTNLPSNIILDRATDINDRGQIVGWYNINYMLLPNGQINPNWQIDQSQTGFGAFLLTPSNPTVPPILPEPVTLLLLVTGGMVGAVMKRRWKV